MNDLPHTHDLVVRQSAMAVHIEYGDTTECLLKRFGQVSDRRIRRGVRRVIRQHDAGSQRAGRTASQIAAIVAEEKARRSSWVKS